MKGKQNRYLNGYAAGMFAGPTVCSQVGQLLEGKIRECLSQLSSCWGGNINVCIDAWVAGRELTMIDDLCIWRGERSRAAGLVLKAQPCARCCSMDYKR